MCKACLFWDGALLIVRQMFRHWDILENSFRGKRLHCERLLHKIDKYYS